MLEPSIPAAVAPICRSRPAFQRLQARHPQVTLGACRFLVTYMCAPDGGQPTVITDLMRDWPALERWQDLDYLSR